MRAAREKKKRDKSKDLHPPASPPTRPSYTIHLHTDPGILFTDWFIWTFYSFVLFCGELQIIPWWDSVAEVIFASRLKQNKKSQLWTIASSSSQHSEAPQVKSSSQQTFTRGAQLIRSLKTGSFLGCFCAMIAPSSPIKCTPSFCIKHLSDSSPFVFCSAVLFTALPYNLQRNPQRLLVNSFTERSFQASSSSLFPPSFTSAIRFH